MSRDLSPDTMHSALRVKRGPRVASSRERASSERVRMEPTCLIDEVLPPWPTIFAAASSGAGVVVA